MLEKSKAGPVEALAHRAPMVGPPPLLSRSLDPPRLWGRRMSLRPARWGVDFESRSHPDFHANRGPFSLKLQAASASSLRLPRSKTPVDPNGRKLLDVPAGAFSALLSAEDNPLKSPIGRYLEYL